MKYHVLTARFNSSALPATATGFDTLSTGNQLTIKNSTKMLTGAGTAGGTADVSTADIQTGNGVVHVVNGVLLPLSAQRTVVGIATGNTASFSTLVELLTAADLVSTLTIDTPDTAYTVFAPNNAAFAKIDAATIACLKNSTNKVSVHTSHVYHGTWFAPPSYPLFTCSAVLGGDQR